MAREEKKTVKKKAPAKKPANSTTAKKKAPAKKAPAKKGAAPKKAPAKKKVAKTGSTPVKKKRKDIPAGLSVRNESGSANLDYSIVSNKKKKKKNSKKKYTPEKIFWIVVAVVFLIAAVAVVVFVFQDYSKDSSTPAQLNTPEISKDELAYVNDITKDVARIEEVVVTEQGPIIYVIYTVPAGSPKADVQAEINDAYTKALEGNAKLFETYSFQITVVNSGEEADGVNDYPVMGSLNIGRKAISWMATDGNYVEPVEGEEVTTAE